MNRPRVEQEENASKDWAQKNLLQLIANIKGSARKKDARRLLKPGRLDEAFDFILRDTLDDHQRGFWGSLHPTLVGGEFLPDYKPQEIEIARITMDSTTQDVVRIRASPGTVEQPMAFGPTACWLSHRPHQTGLAGSPILSESTCHKGLWDQDVLRHMKKGTQFVSGFEFVRIITVDRECWTT
jgi:hypothetical protein